MNEQMSSSVCESKREKWTTDKNEPAQDVFKSRRILTNGQNHKKNNERSPK